MNGITIYEFDALAPKTPGKPEIEGLRAIPAEVYQWLEAQCLNISESGEAAWVRQTQRRGHRVVQVTSFVGVVRAPSGFQFEVLPKVGKAIGGGDKEARNLLIKMLRCLTGFRHIQTDNAKLAATQMPLMEVFISEFLHAVGHVIKRGFRCDYVGHRDNLFALRGKLQIAQHLRNNLCRADRFFTAHDEFSTNRPENRLLHAALRCALSFTASQANQQLARELCFAFADIPESQHIIMDFNQVRLDRGMDHYTDALAWARLILNERSPLTGNGDIQAPSLLFPMETVFEAFVAKHLARQLSQHFNLRTQARRNSLVRHQGANWFQLKPDLLVQQAATDRLVLDTKWKLIDGSKGSSADKYGLAQIDFYQLYAYGQSYLNGRGNVVLIYPKTDVFSHPLPVFDFPKSAGLRLWVLPFCLRESLLILPVSGDLDEMFVPNRSGVAPGVE